MSKLKGCKREEGRRSPPGGLVCMKKLYMFEHWQKYQSPANGIVR